MHKEMKELGHINLPGCRILEWSVIYVYMCIYNENVTATNNNDGSDLYKEVNPTAVSMSKNTVSSAADSQLVRKIKWTYLSFSIV